MVEELKYAQIRAFGVEDGPMDVPDEDEDEDPDKDEDEDDEEEDEEETEGAES